MRRALLAISVLLAACGSPRRSLTVAGPPTLDEYEQRGELVFMHNCHSCHPLGEGGLGPSLNNRPLPRWFIETQVRVGFGEMPAFKKEVISREDLRSLSAYLIELRKNKP